MKMKAILRPSKGRFGNRRGFSLLEVMVAFSISAIGLLSFSQAIVGAVALKQATAEQALASNAARQLIESCNSVPFEEVYARFNSDPADDPAAGLIVGGKFSVEGLQVRSDDVDGMVGSIEFPGSSLLVGSEQLREDAVDVGLGVPMDLNGDGVIDASDHSGDYLLLPIRVRIEWRGRGGDSKIEFKTILSGL